MNAFEVNEFSQDNHQKQNEFYIHSLNSSTCKFPFTIYSELLIS